MTRWTRSLATLVLTAASLPGCAVSLFSTTEEKDPPDEQLRELEKRMDRIEEKLPK